MNNKLILYVAAGLTTLTVISVLVANIWDLGSSSFRTWGTTAVLAEITALFIYLAKQSSQFKQVNIYLTFPEELQEVSRNLNWDAENCFIITDNLEKNIRLLKSDIGPGYRVFLDKSLILDILERDVVEFKLMDETGREWRVGPFNLFEKTRNIESFGQQNFELNYD